MSTVKDKSQEVKCLFGHHNYDEHYLISSWMIHNDLTGRVIVRTIKGCICSTCRKSLCVVNGMFFGYDVVEILEEENNRLVVSVFDVILSLSKNVDEIE